MNVEWFYVRSKFWSKGYCAHSCNKWTIRKFILMQSVVSKWVYSVDIGIPSIGIIYSLLRFSQHPENRGKPAGQGPISTRATETRLEIRRKKKPHKTLLWRLSEILGRKKENSEQSKIISPASPPKDSDQSPRERKYKSNCSVFHKDLLGPLRRPVQAPDSIMGISYA